MNRLPAGIFKKMLSGKAVFCILLLLFAAIAIYPAARSWNDESRMATVQSLVEHHTFIIDQTVFIETGDKVFINGHFYSDKPPLPSIIGAIVYVPIYYLGFELKFFFSVAYYLITLFTVKLFYLLSLAAFYKALEFTGTEKNARLLLTAALGIGSLCLTWSSTFNNHSLAASFLIIGFYFLLKTGHTTSVNRYIFLGALFLALGGASDFPMSIFFIGFFFYALTKPDLRKKAYYFAIAFIIVYAPILFINYHISGSIMPVQLNKSFFIYPGSPWIESNELSGMETNSIGFTLKYAADLLFGPGGFITYNPLLLLALYYMISFKNEGFSREAFIIGTCSFIVFAYYAVMTNNLSGWSYSVRWLVPLIPLLYFFLFPVFKQKKPVALSLFAVFFSLSIIFSFVGLINPWANILDSPAPFVSNFIFLFDLASKKLF